MWCCKCRTIFSMASASLSHGGHKHFPKSRKQVLLCCYVFFWHVSLSNTKLWYWPCGFMGQGYKLSTCKRPLRWEFCSPRWVALHRCCPRLMWTLTVGNPGACILVTSPKLSPQTSQCFHSGVWKAIDNDAISARLLRLLSCPNPRPFNGLRVASPITVFLIVMIDGDCEGSLWNSLKKKPLSEEIRRMDAAVGTLLPEPDVNYEKRT